MNKFQTIYNENRKNMNLKTNVEIVEKTLILSVSNDLSNVVAVKNIKNNNAEMAYNAAFEEAVRNFFELPEEQETVSPVVSEMMPTEEELMKQLAAENTANTKIEKSVGSGEATPVVEENIETPIIPETTFIPMESTILETPVEMNVPVPPVETEIPTPPAYEKDLLDKTFFPTINSELVPPVLPTDFVDTMPEFPIIEEPVVLQASTTNPVQEQFDEMNPVYSDESQAGVGNPAKTLITFGLATGRIIEECGDAELLWYIQHVQPTSKFASLLEDMKSYMNAKTGNRM